MLVNKATTEARCEAGKLHFMLNSQGLIEVKCRACASKLEQQLGGRHVVFHYFNLDGELVATREFRDARDLIED